MQRKTHITVWEAARRLGISRRHTRRLIDGGFLKAVEGSHPTDRRIRLLVSIQSVSGYARRFARTPTPTKYKACAECGQSFEQTIPTRRYCEKRCKKKVENRRRRAREKATV